MKFFIQLAVIVTVFSVGACSSSSPRLRQAFDDREKISPTSFPIKPPPGPEIYQKGWTDGCKSGLASTNELVDPMYHQKYSYTLDRKLMYDRMYYRVWEDAYNYCAFTVLTIIKYNT